MQNCNRCNPTTRCRGGHKERNRIDSKGKCNGFIQPYDKWKLAEMVLAHPTSLNAALLALPFKTNIDRYIKGR